jgi:carbon monoxide dehydrogenase subunit G
VRIEEKFTVSAPADAVWAFLTDPERVAAALPGAEITEKLDENTYKGGMGVKVGPLAAAYTGTVAFDLDEDARSAVVHAKGQGKAGMGNADMKMTSTVTPLGPGETEVTVEAQLSVTGILAQLGRGMMQHVSKKMFKEFTEVLGKELR